MENFGFRPTVSPTVSAIQLMQGARVHFIQPDRNTAGFVEERKTDKQQGDYFEQKIVFNVRSLRISIDQTRLNLRNRRVHIIFRDKGGLTRIAYNMRVTDSATIEQQKTGRNRYDFTFTAQSKLPTPSIPDMPNIYQNAGIDANNEPFRIIPLAELQDGLIIRLRIENVQGGYTEAGTLLGTLARYLRRAEEGEDWRNMIGFTNLVSGTNRVRQGFDVNDDIYYY